eukprot:269412-Amphidinium_carterae.1
MQHSAKKYYIASSKICEVGNGNPPSQFCIAGAVEPPLIGAGVCGMVLLGGACPPGRAGVCGKTSSSGSTWRCCFVAGIWNAGVIGCATWPGNPGVAGSGTPAHPPGAGVCGGGAPPLPGPGVCGGGIAPLPGPGVCGSATGPKTP